MTNADTWTVETWDNSILCIGRYYDGDKIYGLFNFSEYDKTAWINERDGLYKDLITGQEMEAAGVNIPAYGFYWLKKKMEMGAEYAVTQLFYDNRKYFDFVERARQAGVTIRLSRASSPSRSCHNSA